MLGNSGTPMSYGNTSSNSGGLISIPAEKSVVSAQTDSTSIEPAIEGKWSRGATLLFILVFCGLSWTGVIVAVVLTR